MKDYKTKKKKLRKKNGESGTTFDSEDLDKALRQTQDLLGRALCEFVVLKDTAKDMLHDNLTLTGQEITLGIEKKHLTKEVLSTFSIRVKQDHLDDWYRDDFGFHFTSKGVPVHIQIIKKKWKFLKNKDLVFYRADEFKIPNPFDLYWKSRFFVR